MKLKRIESGNYSITLFKENKLTEVTITKESHQHWKVTHGEYGDSNYWLDSFNTLKDAKECLKKEYSN